MSNVVALRDRHAASLDEENDGRPTPTAIVVDAVVQALRAYPTLNASIDTDGRSIHHHGRQHIGIAVDTDKGLVVPIIRDAGDLNLRGLSRRIAEIADRASEARSPRTTCRPAPSRSPTPEAAAPCSTPRSSCRARSASLGIGDIVERAVVVRRPDGERAIAIRSMAYLALTYDHRLVDGADAARFLTFVKERLEAEHPDSELG